MNKEDFSVRKTALQKRLQELYEEELSDDNFERYRHVANSYAEEFKEENFTLFSAPGRMELIGNHTDHNQGKVLAGSINMDCIAAAGKNNTSKIKIISETYHQTVVIDLNALPDPGEVHKTEALVAGIVRGFLVRNYHLGGFNVYTTSNVPEAAGVSSSASFEMLVCRIIDYFFQNDSLNPVIYSKIGKYAENIYWNKNSGLLDQMSCALGGLSVIDFEEEETPKIKQVFMDFKKHGYDLCIVWTGGNHEDLTLEYSSIPQEMRQVANCLLKDNLRQSSLEEVLKNAHQIRESAGDRALLRAIHFFDENKRVQDAMEAMDRGDIKSLFNAIEESGNSSWKYLQNCSMDALHQPVAVALAMAQSYIRSIRDGVCRVHGGGFAGTILCIIPHNCLVDFTGYMEEHLEKDCVFPISIRKEGAVAVEI